MMMTISFDGVGLSFGSHRLFSSLNATIPSGQITIITGHNGSGKSTFLQLAAKFIAPDTGKVIATDGGVLLEKDAFRSRLAMITPEWNLYAKLTAEENLQFLLGLRGINLSVEEIPPLLERVGLKWEEIRNTFAGKLSTGMRQRVKLATLLAADADVWMLDEPCTNLDASGLHIVLKEIRQAASKNKLILWATNDPREEAAADALIHLPWN